MDDKQKPRDERLDHLLSVAVSNGQKRRLCVQHGKPADFWKERDVKKHTT